MPPFRTIDHRPGRQPGNQRIPVPRCSQSLAALLLVVAVLALPALAANPPSAVIPLKPIKAGVNPAEPKSMQNRYRVEMVFFTFNTPSNFTQEQWRQGLASPDLHRAVNLFGKASAMDAKGFKVLPPSTYRLDAAARRLQASGRFTVIGHISWEQPGLSITQAKPVVIQMGTDYGPLYPQLMQPRFAMSNGQTIEIPAPTYLYQLQGTVKIVLSRYLHLYTDLVLRVPSKPQTGSAPLALSTPPTPASASTGANALSRMAPMLRSKLVEDIPAITDPAHAQPAPDGTLTDIHIIEHRRTRSRLLNYLDNPMLGILFEIWPIGNSR